MWRIPLNKLYRAFPELDAFTDAECELYVKRVHAQRATHRAELAAGFALTLTGCAAILMVLTHLAGWARQLAHHPIDRRMWESLILTASVILIISAVFLAWFLVRDWALIHAIRTRLLLVRCPACRQSLVGVPNDSDQVRCPECGQTHSLTALGLTPDDLRPR